MKSLIKVIVFVTIIAFLSSCEKQDIITDHYELVIIDPEEPDYYTYADSKNPENGWVEYWNGDYKYYFELEQGSVTLHPTQKLVKAEYLRSTFDKNPVPLEVSGKNSVQYTSVTKDGVFKLIY